MSDTGNYSKFYEMVKKAKNIGVIGHIRPDGDCIGSALAVKLAFEGKEREVDVYADGTLPRQFAYLKGYDQIITEEPREYKLYDMLILVDVNTVDRLGKFETMIKQAGAIACIDHHLGFAIPGIDVVFSNTESASAGEIVFDIFKNIKIEITPAIADALYTAVSTDTGCFLYPSTRPQSHFVAAELLKAGANMEMINYQNFRVFDRRLLSVMEQILRTMRLYCNETFAVALLKKVSYKGYIFDGEERHKFKQFVSDIKGVRASAFITKEGSEYNVSLRSHGDLNVETVARKFGGGGHKNAAGFTVKCRYGALVRQLATEMGKLIDEKKLV